LLITGCFAQENQAEKHMKVAMRMIGHQVLLNSNDSISRVLPIIKVNNQYKIQFESAFDFKPVALVTVVDSIVAQTNIPRNYILEVIRCETEEVVYSFKMDDLEQSDIIPCGVRLQPKDFYSLLFTPLTKRKANTDIQPITRGFSNKSNTGTSPMKYGIIVILLLLFGGFIFLWKRKRSTKKDPNLIALGEFHFDKRNTELLINHQRIELTSKEADLLLLLYNTVNTTVEREVILNKVWGDQGDYVGRTLDVFISKLRKKLEADSNVKIRNIRGVGYKLVMKV